MIAGGPDTVREQTEDMIKRLRLGTVFSLLHMGDMPDDKTRYSSQLFAEKVMPQLQNFWPELEHDDRWWPKGMDNRVRPEDGLDHARRPRPSSRRSADGRATRVHRLDQAGDRRRGPLEGGSGPDLVWFHGLVGLAPVEPALEALADSFTVHAPIWPGYGAIDNEGAIEDMLDFALLGWDIVDALGIGAGRAVDALGIGAGRAVDAESLERPSLVGHSFGAMVAAEMAAIARTDLARLALVAPFGLWLDAHPIPDPFAVLPFELTELLLADPANASQLLSEGTDLESDEGLAEFMVANARRLGTAGKVMFPIPNRRLSKRLYRVGAPTLVVMAGADSLVTEPYGDAWVDAIAEASLVTIDGAGHLANLERPTELADALTRFLPHLTTVPSGDH